MNDPMGHEEETVADSEGSDRVFTGDYDGNGISDLLLFKQTQGEMAMYLFGSHSVSRNEVRDDQFLPGSWDPGDFSVVSSADFDGDGFCDIALRHTSGELLLLYMEGHEAQGSFLVSELPQSWSVDGVGLENPASE
jgi:hypothetical protein